MPNGYEQTAQSLERFLCDRHISLICECPNVTNANEAILECLIENATLKEHIVEFCERLLLIRNTPKLTHVIKTLSECKCLHV